MVVVSSYSPVRHCLRRQLAATAICARARCVCGQCHCHHQTRSAVLCSVAATFLQTRHDAHASPLLLAVLLCILLTMTELASDPPDVRALFSPVRNALREASSDAPGPADTPTPTNDGNEAGPILRKRTMAYVELPTLASVQKTKYRSVAEDTLHSDEEFAHQGVDRVLGEVQEGPTVNYYVRYHDGIVHKVNSGAYMTLIPALSFRIVRGCTGVWLLKHIFATSRFLGNILKNIFQRWSMSMVSRQCKLAVCHAVTLCMDEHRDRTT